MASLGRERARNHSPKIAFLIREADNQCGAALGPKPASAKSSSPTQKETIRIAESNARIKHRVFVWPTTHSPIPKHAWTLRLRNARVRLRNASQSQNILGIPPPRKGEPTERGEVRVGEENKKL